MRKIDASLVVTGALVIAGLAIGGVIDRQLPSVNDVLDQPFVHSVGIGETAELRTADVTVTSWDLAQSVTQYGSRFETVGAWMVLEIEVSARGQSLVLSGMELVSQGGRTYGGSADVINNCDPAQPGVPMTCQVAFEVLPEDLPGLIFHIPAAGISGSPSDDLAIVDLGVERTNPRLASPAPHIELFRTRFGEGT